MKHRPLVALSSAAILAVYTAGYMRTRPAAERFDAEAAPRRAATAPPSAEVAPPSLSPIPAKPVARLPRVESQPPSSVASTQPSPEPQSSPSPAGGENQNAEVQDPPSAVAEPVAAAEPAPSPAAIAEYKDGSYVGWGSCRHGDIQASVTIASGRITAATVARCLTRYACSWIEPLYPQVVSRQSAEVDYVSGATESTDAFHDAVVDALSKAK